MLLLHTLLAATACTVVHVLAVAAAGSALGARTEEVGLLSGGGVVVRAANPRVRVGWLPVGGFVRFVGAGEPSVAGGYEGLATWRRAAIPLAGPLAVLSVACALLGPQEALASAARLPAQYLAGAKPLSEAQTVLDAWASLGGGPASAVWGTVAAKLGTLNLLPLGTLAGGQALLAVVPVRGAARVVYEVGSMIVLVGLALAWLVAIRAWLT